VFDVQKMQVASLKIVKTSKCGFVQRRPSSRVPPELQTYQSIFTNFEKSTIKGIKKGETLYSH
jgi:hypothetical protein